MKPNSDGRRVRSSCSPRPMFATMLANRTARMVSTTVVITYSIVFFMFATLAGIKEHAPEMATMSRQGPGRMRWLATLPGNLPACRAISGRGYTLASRDLEASDE